MFIENVELISMLQKMKLLKHPINKFWKGRPLLCFGSLKKSYKSGHFC